MLRNDANISVTIFITKKSVATYKERIENNIRFVEFSPYLSNTSDFLGYETMISASFEKITSIYSEKEGYPDFIEAQEYNGIAYYLLHKKQISNIDLARTTIIIVCHCPSFLTFQHNHINTYQFPYFWIGEMERFCIMAADICISPSKYLEQRIKEARPEIERKFEILPNPYASYKTSGKDITATNKNNFTFIGKLSPAKGLLIMLDAFEQLWNKGYNITLTLIGDQYYFYHATQSTIKTYLVKRYSSFLKDKRLKITGALPPHSIDAHLQSSSFVILPSTIENFPYVAVEAMASGRIVIASQQGGQSELIEHGLNGFLFDSRDRQSLCGIIDKVLKLESQELLTISAAARSKVVKYCDPKLYIRNKNSIIQSFIHHKHSSDNYPLYAPSELKNEQYSYGDLLSLVIPYFNMGKFIFECLHSVLSSNYPLIEIIIINDGSTEENTIEILNRVEQLDDRIKIVHQKNRGLSHTRNIGALLAKGVYLAFLDADDMVHPEYFKKAINILATKKNISFVGCWVEYFGETSGTWPTFNPAPPLVLYHNLLNSSSLIYKRTDFCKEGLNDPSFIYGMEDYESVIRLIKSGQNGVIIPEKLFRYRVRKESMSRKFNRANMLFTYEMIAVKNKSLFSNFGAEINNLLNANGPGYIKDNPTLNYENEIAGRNLKKILSPAIKLVKSNKTLRKLALFFYEKIK